jgi:hypothetical protein
MPIMAAECFDIPVMSPRPEMPFMAAECFDIPMSPRPEMLF